ncbi:MAG: substrate-binding domain-containing protein [Alphaproteobacteria bacterium]
MLIKAKYTALLLTALSSSLAYGESIHILSTSMAQTFVQDIRLPVVATPISNQEQFNVFCNGIGGEEADILFTNEKITQSQIKKCASNGVYDILELPLAYNALLLQTASLSVNLDLSQQDLYEAIRAYEQAGASSLIEANGKKSWIQIHPELKDAPINFVQQRLSEDFDKLYLDYVFGRCVLPKKSQIDAAIKKQVDIQYQILRFGLPAAFVHKEVIAQSLTEQQSRYQLTYCQQLRDDAYKIVAKEQFDNLKASAFPADNQIFIMPFENGDKDLLTLRVNGKVPMANSIKNKEYPLAYPIYAYIKMGHIGVKKGLKQWVDNFMGNQPEYLIRQAQRSGLIPPYADDIQKSLQAYGSLKGYIENP